MKRRAALEDSKPKKRARRSSNPLARTSRGLGNSNARHLPEIQIAPRRGLNPETKFVDNSFTLQLSNTNAPAGHIGLLNAINLGTEVYNRIGRKINVKSVTCRCLLDTIANPVIVNDVFRIALIWDEQPTGVLPNREEFWQGISAGGATNNDNLSFANINNTSRFRILRTHMVPISIVTQGLESPEGKAFWQWKVPMNTITQFNAGVAGTIADITTGAIYLVAYGFSSPVAQWQLRCYTRTKFLD